MKSFYYLINAMMSQLPFELTSNASESEATRSFLKHERRILIEKSDTRFETSISVAGSTDH